MGYAFISYSHKDSGFVSFLATSLKRHGIEYWYDWERGVPDPIPPGSQWRRTIHDALKNAERLILVVSQASMDSDEVCAEWSYALSLNKQVIPILLRKCDFNYRLSILQWADFSTRDERKLDPDTFTCIDFEREYQAGLNSLLAVLGECVPTTELPPAADPAPFVKAAKSPNWHIRLHAVEAIIALGAGAAGGAVAATLVQALDDEEKTIADLAARALGQSADPQAKKALFQRRQAIEPEWVEIPAGFYLYGEDVWKDNKLFGKKLREQKRLWLDTFYIAKYPVTNREYVAFVRAAGREWKIYDPKLRRYLDWTEWPYLDRRLNHPAVDVSWRDAIAYCEWLTGQLGYKVTLPTEERWEKAARGPDGRVYPWGDTFDPRLCNTTESGIGATTPVDAYPVGASYYGVMDMSGNVWEWCLNEYGNPANVGLTGNAPRVLRGGSWLSNEDSARAAFRLRPDPIIGPHNGGFRVCGAAPS